LYDEKNVRAVSEGAGKKSVGEEPRWDEEKKGRPPAPRRGRTVGVCRWVRKKARWASAKLVPRREKGRHGGGRREERPSGSREKGASANLFMLKKRGPAIPS